MRARVTVTLKAGVLDPQGVAIEGALKSLGFREASGVRVGKVIDLEIDAPSREAAAVRVRKMCDDLLANPVIETYRIDWPEEGGGRG